MTHLIGLPLSTVCLILHRVKCHLSFRVLGKSVIWAGCFIPLMGWAQKYSEHRLTGKPPSPLNPKLFLPARWQVPVWKSKQIRMVAAVLPASPGVFPANTTVELLMPSKARYHSLLTLHNSSQS